MSSEDSVSQGFAEESEARRTRNDFNHPRPPHPRHRRHDQVSDGRSRRTEEAKLRGCLVGGGRAQWEGGGQDVECDGEELEGKEGDL